MEKPLPEHLLINRERAHDLTFEALAVAIDRFDQDGIPDKLAAAGVMQQAAHYFSKRPLRDDMSRITRDDTHKLPSVPFAREELTAKVLDAIFLIHEMANDYAEEKQPRMLLHTRFDSVIDSIERWPAEQLFDVRDITLPLESARVLMLADKKLSSADIEERIEAGRSKGREM